MNEWWDEISPPEKLTVCFVGNARTLHLFRSELFSAGTLTGMVSKEQLPSRESMVENKHLKTRAQSPLFFGSLL